MSLFETISLRAIILFISITQPGGRVKPLNIQSI